MENLIHIIVNNNPQKVLGLFGSRIKLSQNYSPLDYKNDTKFDI